MGNKISRIQFLISLNMYCCINIGTNSIKVLQKDSDGKVLKWGFLERKNKPFHTSILPMDENDVIACLKILLDKMGSEPREAVIAIPAFLTFTTVAGSADPAQIPAAPGTFYLDVIDLGGGTFFLTAVPKDVVEKYGRILGEVGFESARWESESVILARNFGNFPEPTLIVGLDERSTTFVVARNAKPVFVEQTDFSLKDAIPHLSESSAQNHFAEDGYAFGKVRDVILNKVKNIITDKKIKNVRWVTEKNFLNF